MRGRRGREDLVIQLRVGQRDACRELWAIRSPLEQAAKRGTVRKTEGAGVGGECNAVHVVLLVLMMLFVWHHFGWRGGCVGGSEEDVWAKIHLGEACPLSLGSGMGICHDEVA